MDVIEMRRLALLTEGEIVAYWNARDAEPTESLLSA
jgi:hypothetical protein